MHKNGGGGKIGARQQHPGQNAGNRPKSFLAAHLTSNGANVFNISETRHKGDLSMPVYEFYCGDCHTIFNFLSRQVNTQKRPVCPKCGRPELERQVSSFAFSRGRQEEANADMPDLDEDKLERAMMGLAGEMQGMDENDPLQMAQLMRKLTEATGM